MLNKFIFILLIAKRLGKEKKNIFVLRISKIFNLLIINQVTYFFLLNNINGTNKVKDKKIKYYLVVQNINNFKIEKILFGLPKYFSKC